MLSDARKKANKKYIETKCDDITLRVPKGRKEEIKKVAESKGESINSYINRLIEEDLKNK